MPTEATSAALLVAALLAAAAALAATHLERPGAADDCAAAGASVRMQLEELREELARRQQQVEHWRALEASSASLVTASERSHAACREAHEDAARQLEAALGQRTLPARSDGCEVCPLPPPPLVGTGRKRWPIMLAGVAKEVVEPPAAGAAQPSGADDVMLTAVVRPPEGGRAGVAGCVGEEQRYERLELPLHQAGSVLGLDAAPLAIGSMRAGERAAFFVAAGGGCPGPLGLELHLHAVAEVEDLSSDGGRSVLKRVLSPGKGRETPARGATLTVRLGSPSLANASLVPAAAAALGGDAVGRDGALSVGIDDGRVVGDALRLALHSMRRGELARVSLSQEQAALEPLLAPSRGGGGPVQAQVELISFRHQARDAAPSAASAAAAAAPPADPLAGAASLKEEGNSLFSAGRTKEACAAYSRALGMAAGGGGGGGDASRALTLALRNNLAGCELKADRPADALSHADEALLLSPGAAKPLYRRAQALLALGRVGEAAAAAERAAAANPASADVARLQASIAERGGGAGSSASDASGAGAASAGAEAAPADPLAGAASLKEEGNSLFSAGRTKEACAAYSRALGMAAGGGGGGGDASRALTLALRNNLAGCELKADRPADALSHADEALLLSPGAAKPLYRRAQALLALGRVGEAAAAAERAAAANPASADVARLQASIAERGPA